ncbi:hypothetical protein HaLaN_32183 [Haematococcus lacustris]|uniref:Uncharacterized protein n=1 Tax=Haematococcus lacustris TaxID=44745 RepID=A0A6A0AJG0_HAELA|nr:hypothetical protein HaLaN_32183 [Haematococcus lacustris]
MPAVQLVGQTISGSVILGSQWMGGQGSGRKRKANAETNAGAAGPEQLSIEQQEHVMKLKQQQRKPNTTTAYDT